MAGFTLCCRHSVVSGWQGAPLTAKDLCRQTLYYIMRRGQGSVQAIDRCWLFGSEQRVPIDWDFEANTRARQVWAHVEGTKR